MTHEELKEKRERFRVYGEICLLMEEKGYGDYTFEADELEEALGEPILVFVDDDDDHAQKLDNIEFADCMLWLSYGENYVMFMDVCSWTLHQIYEALKNYFKDGEKQGEQKPDETEKGTKRNNGEIPNSAWSDEDERRINHIIAFMSDEERIKDTERLFPIEEDINWLKFLRPHSHWKPSENELEVLRLVAEKDGTCLMGLYENLKKLREE